MVPCPDEWPFTVFGPDQSLGRDWDVEVGLETFRVRGLGPSSLNLG